MLTFADVCLTYAHVCSCMQVDLEEQDDAALAARHKVLPLKTLQQKVAALEEQNSLESKMNSLLAKNEKLAQQNSLLTKNLGLLVR